MHISDIHMNKYFNKVMSNILRDELSKFIEENKITVDFLFLTGDFRDSVYMKEKGLKEDVRLQASNVSEYILHIAESLKVPSERIFLVPGNHDLNRNEDDEAVIKKIKETYPEYRENLNDLERSYLLERFHFFELIDKKVHSNAGVECSALHRLYKEKKADILCLNTAMTCYGDEKEEELILDSEYIRELVHTTQRQVPFIVLAHHDLKFLTKKEHENLKCILKNRKVFYLCGHSHKLEYGYDDESTLWKIMAGTIKDVKDEKEAASIISVVETSDSGMISKLQFYQYNFVDKTGWKLYQEIVQQRGQLKLGFVGQDMNKDVDASFDMIEFPLKPTTKSTEEQRLTTQRILAKIKSDLCFLGKKQQIVVSSKGLPVTAGIVIGYALHKNQQVQLDFQYAGQIFSSASEKKKITFEEKEQSYNISSDKPLSLYVYIQAKSSDDGRSVFDEYIERQREQNIITLSFVNKEKYDNSFDLEASARHLADRIIACREDVKRKGYKNIEVHLFYNGFWGLALLLGNQMPTTFPVQLYDYDMDDEQYHPSFFLKANIFNII